MFLSATIYGYPLLDTADKKIKKKYIMYVFPRLPSASAISYSLMSGKFHVIFLKCIYQFYRATGLNFFKKTIV